MAPLLTGTSGPSGRVFATAWILFWVLMVAVAIQDFRRSGGTALWQPVLWETSSALTATALLLAQRRFTRGWDHLVALPWRWFGLQALCLPLVCAGFIPIAFGMRHGVYALMGEVCSHQPWLQVAAYESVKLTLFYGLFSMIVFGVLSYRQLLEEKLRSEHAAVLLRDAQLQRLTQQMQPHFLFNALNTISSLLHTDPNKADGMLVQLADLLRSTLVLSESRQVALDSELQLLRAYAALMEARFAGRVVIDWHIAPDSLACSVPALCLQPLLENTFKHTVERVRECTRITISAVCKDGQLHLCVSDDTGTLQPVAGTGLGLHNLRERLAMLHAQGASLTLTALSPGVRSEMTLPCAS